MLKRLLLGLLAGGLMGAAVAAVLVFGLHVVALGGLLAYVSAAVSGALTGLVAGKPIWAPGAKIEAGLKALFGALLAAGGMYAVRTWLHAEVNLEAIQPGLAGPLGEVPFAALPLVAAVLGVLYEVDNGDEAPKGGARNVRVGTGKAKGAALPPADDEDDAVRPAASKPLKRR